MLFDKRRHAARYFSAYATTGASDADDVFADEFCAAMPMLRHYRPPLRAADVFDASAPPFSPIAQRRWLIAEATPFTTV